MRIKTKGFREAARRMKQRKGLFTAQNPEAYNAVANTLNGSIRKNFDAGGRPKWPKRIHQYPWPILVKTGTMKQAALTTSQQWQHHGDTHTIQVKGPKYGIYHQYGSRKLPVRKYALLQQPEIQAMHQVFRDAFLKAK